MTALTTPPAPSGRLRAAWAAAHAPVPGTPNWARIAALAIPLVVLPSSLWRILGVALHVPIIEDLGSAADENGTLPDRVPVELYVVLLSIVSEGLAFLAVGLIARWGEVFPRWIPGLRGRRVPILAAVLPAAVGATILTLLWTWLVGNLVIGRNVQGEPLPDDFPLDFDGWQGTLAILAYVPLVAWGPLLAAVTVAYYRRRARTDLS